MFIFNERIPYTDEMLASIFRRDVNIVRMALKTFENFGMIEIIDNVITIPNWGKHQTLDTYEKRKLRDRERNARKRAEQKALIALSADASADASPDTSVDASPGVALPDKEVDIEVDKDRDIKKDAPDEPPLPPPPPEPKPAKGIEFGSLSPRMITAVEKWLQYKKERRESYKPTGLNALISQIENNVDRYGEDAVIELIASCMAANWRGIIFEKLKNQQQPGRGPARGSEGNVFAEMLREEGGAL